MNGTRGNPVDTFRDLALALSEEERRDLSRKISRSLSLRQQDELPVGRPAVPDSERHALIASEIEALSFLRRVRFFLRRVFSSKPHDQAFIEFRLSELRRQIRSRCGAMSPLEHHSVCPEIASSAWELYRSAYPLIPAFLDLWKSGTFLQECIEYLLSQRIPSARSELFDFASVEELQDAFMERELKSDVRKLVVDRLSMYLEEVPDDLFQHLEEGVLPLYLLKPLGLFDYNRLFSVFGFDPGIAVPEETPPFTPAPTSAALPLVEELFYGLYSALRLDKGFYVHLDVLDRYLELKDFQDNEESGQGSGRTDADPTDSVAAHGDHGANQVENSEAKDPEYEARRERVQELRDGLDGMYAAAKKASSHIPFPEVVRFYRRDPWHRIAVAMPKLRLREFYHSYLMMGTLSQLDENFGAVRVGVVTRLTEELFDGPPAPFEYFRPAVLSPPEKLGLPSFRYVRSGVILRNFLHQIYRPRMQEMVRILSRVLPVRQRDSSSSLVVHVAGVEQAVADLDEYDRSFASETDDGKSFLRIRYGVEKDATLHRSFRNIVRQKDRELRSIIDLALEHFRGLFDAFSSVERTMSDRLRQRYAEADQHVSGVDGLDRLLEDYSEKIMLVDKLLKQSLAMEEGY